MNGPGHYREAERLLELAEHPRRVISGVASAEAPVEFKIDQIVSVLPDPSNVVDDTLAAAQVHATLALAAATAYQAVTDYCGDESGDSREWTQVTS